MSFKIPFVTELYFAPHALDIFSSSRIQPFLIFVCHFLFVHVKYIFAVFSLL